MSDDGLGSRLDDERAGAIRCLLRSPILDVGTDRDAYTLVSRHAAWLVDWFETTCGWALHVDPAAGFVRLAKRQADPDVTRPLVRPRGGRGPFDRRRYELLCLVAAELIGHPMTTIGLLAEALASSTDFATEKLRDRSAFVDALLILRRWGALSVSSGELEDYTGDEQANALLTADLSRLHRLVASVTAPSNLPEDASFDDAVAALLAEPRYGADRHDSGDQHRWTRHHLARRLLDDPALHLEDCSDGERAYLTSGSGRSWLRARIAEAGFVLEERAEGLLVVDLSGRSSDSTFPGPHGTTHQMALLLIDELVDETGASGDSGSGADHGRRASGDDASGAGHGPGPGGNGSRPGAGDDPVRRPRTRSLAELVEATTARLDRHPSWAKAYRDDGGPERLTSEAVAVLASFDLVRLRGSLVEARPVICRYRPGTTTVSGAAADDPTTDGHAATLF